MSTNHRSVFRSLAEICRIRFVTASGCSPLQSLDALRRKEILSDWNGTSPAERKVA